MNIKSPPPPPEPPTSTTIILLADFVWVYSCSLLASEEQLTRRDLNVYNRLLLLDQEMHRKPKLSNLRSEQNETSKTFLKKISCDNN